MDADVIAKRLIDLRGGKSRETVAAAVEISTSALAMYENAARIPRDEIKLRIAKYYGVSVESIFLTKNVT